MVASQIAPRLAANGDRSPFRRGFTSCDDFDIGSISQAVDRLQELSHPASLPLTESAIDPPPCRSFNFHPSPFNT